MFADRKTGYKLPPTTIRDKLVSQEARRNKALEEQKRRRAQRVDSTRQLDLFAGLNLGASDDEDEPEDEEPKHAPASVAQYASLLLQPVAEHAIPPVLPSPSGSDMTFATDDSIQHPQAELSSSAKKKSKKRSGKNKRRTNKASKWADKCMYAELLEMASDEPWSEGMLSDNEEIHDGLPKDLESGWVAVAPVPVGKRCLAVTHQSAGVIGVSPNTTLRSRLLGKMLIQRFPSSLPPLTILDCILDENWRDNGILHVLDVVKWKGQDVGDCEAGFRFWWRDTRLAELAPSLPPSTSAHPHFVPIVSSSSSMPGSESIPSTSPPALKYRFPYPTTFIPVPYHTSTTLASLDTFLLPLARSIRGVDVMLPLPPPSLPLPTSQEETNGDGTMEVEPFPPFTASGMTSSTVAPFAFGAPSTSTASPFELAQAQPQTQLHRTQILPDGLLLYVSEASYEPGTSPLSSWVPISSYDKDKTTEGPLDLFHQLVRKRLSRKDGELPPRSGTEADVEMEM